jgi:Arm DNA-binding domain
MRERFEPSDVAEILESLAPYGRKGAGGNLYLRKDANGRGRWVFNFWFMGQRHDLTLGAWPDIGLEQARLLRDDAAGQLAGGYYPTFETSAERLARRQRAEARMGVIQRQLNLIDGRRYRP